MALWGVSLYCDGKIVSAFNKLVYDGSGDRKIIFGGGAGHQRVAQRTVFSHKRITTGLGLAVNPLRCWKGLVETGCLLSATALLV
jgi:hypothetical protein